MNVWNLLAKNSKKLKTQTVSNTSIRSLKAGGTSMNQTFFLRMFFVVGCACAAIENADGDERPNAEARGATVPNIGRDEGMPDESSPLRWHGEPRLHRDRNEGRRGILGSDVYGPRRKFAICIGINDYSKSPSYSSLRFAARDAAAMAESLLANAGFDRVLLISDAKPGPELMQHLDDGRLTYSDDVSEDSIENRVEGFLPQANRFDDVVVLHYSGHGDSDSFAYLVAGDGNEVRLSHLFETLSSYRYCQARNKLVILDACKSGVQQQNGRPMALGFRQAVTEPGQRLSVITGCDVGELSYEDEDIGHGRLTWAVLDALSGNGFAEGEEYLLVSHLYQHVLDVFSTRRWLTQSPVQFSSGQIFSIAWRELPQPPPLDDFEWQALQEDLAKARRLHYSDLQPLHLEHAASAYRYCLRATGSTPLDDEETRSLHGRLLGERALVLYRQGNLEAIRPLRREATEFPSAVPLFAVIDALIQADEGKTAEALDPLQQAARVHPSQVGALGHYFWLRKGAAEEHNQQHMAAVTSYANACRRAAEVPGLTGLSKSLFDAAGRNDHANYFAAMLSDQPDSAVVTRRQMLELATDIFGESHDNTRVVRAGESFTETIVALPREERIRLVGLDKDYRDHFAAGEYESCLEKVEQIMLREKDLLGSHPNYFNSVYYKADALYAVERYEEALATYREARDGFITCLGENSWLVAAARVGVANALQKLDRRTDACDELTKALQCLSKIDRPADYASVASSLFALLEGEVSDDARSTFVNDTLAQLKECEDGMALFQKGVFLVNAGRHADAIAEFRKSAELMRLERRDAEEAWLWDWIGDAHVELGQDQEAGDSYTRAHSMALAVGNTNLTIRTIWSLSRCLKRQGQYAEAEKRFQKALELESEKKNDVDVARANYWRGDCMRAVGDYEGSLQCYQVACPVLVKFGAHDEASRYYNHAAFAALECSENATAREMFLKAHESYVKLEDGTEKAIDALANAAAIDQEEKIEDQLTLDECLQKIADLLLTLPPKKQGDLWLELATTMSDDRLPYRNYPLRLRFAASAVAAYKKADDRLALGNAEFWNGKFFEHSGEYEAALPFYDRALAIAEELADEDLKRSAIQAKATAFEGLSRYPEAREQYETAAKLYLEAEDHQHYIWYLYGAAMCHRADQQDQPPANNQNVFDSFFTAMREFEVRGVAHLQRDEFAHFAEFVRVPDPLPRHFQQFLDFYGFAFATRLQRNNQAGADEILALALEHLRRIEDLASRKAFLDSCIRDAQHHEAAALTAIALFARANLLIDMDSPTEAIQDFQSAEQLFKKLNDSERAALCAVRRAAYGYQQDPQTEFDFLVAHLLTDAGDPREYDLLGKLAAELTTLPGISEDTFESVRSACRSILPTEESLAQFLFQRIAFGKPDSAYLRLSETKQQISFNLLIDIAQEGETNLYSDGQSTAVAVDGAVRNHVFLERADGRHWTIYSETGGGSPDLAVRRRLRVTYINAAGDTVAETLEGYLSHDRKNLVFIQLDANGIPVGRVVETTREWDGPKAEPKEDTSVGIGTGISKTPAGAIVTEILDGGAAAVEGTLQPGSTILEVAQGDGPFESLAGKELNEMVDMIRGDEGSVVRLRVRIAGTSDPVTISIKRTKPAAEQKP